MNTVLGNYKESKGMSMRNNNRTPMMEGIKEHVKMNNLMNTTERKESIVTSPEV